MQSRKKTAAIISLNFRCKKSYIKSELVPVNKNRWLAPIYLLATEFFLERVLIKSLGFFFIDSTFSGEASSFL